jgi:hypothetical protein
MVINFLVLSIKAIKPQNVCPDALFVRLLQHKNYLPRLRLTSFLTPRAAPAAINNETPPSRGTAGGGGATVEAGWANKLGEMATRAIKAIPNTEIRVFIRI